MCCGCQHRLWNQRFQICSDSKPASTTCWLYVFSIPWFPHYRSNGTTSKSSYKDWVNTYKILEECVSQCRCVVSIICCYHHHFYHHHLTGDVLCFFEVLLTFYNLSVAFSEPCYSKQGWALLLCCEIVHSAISIISTLCLISWTCIWFLMIVSALRSNVKVKEGPTKFVLCLKLFWIITHMNSMGRYF